MAAYRPHPSIVDDHTCAIITEAAQILGFLRGYRGPFLDDPAVRLHLLASLHHQLRADLVATACETHEHGYTADQLVEFLTLSGPATR